MLPAYMYLLFLVLADSEFIRFCETEQVVNYTSVTETLTITSPDYPNIQYSIIKSCFIQVSLQQVPLQQVVLHILHQSTHQTDVPECTQEHIITDTERNAFTNKREDAKRDGTQCTIIVDILLTEVQDDVIFYLPAGTRTGFRFTFTGNGFCYVASFKVTFYTFLGGVTKINLLVTCK